MMTAGKAADAPPRWFIFSALVFLLTLTAAVGLGFVGYVGIQKTTLKLRTPPSNTLIGRTVDLGLKYYNGQIARHPLYWGITARNGTRDVDTPIVRQFFEAAMAALAASRFGPFISDIQSMFNIPASGDKYVIGSANDSTMLIKIDNNMSVADHNQKHLVLWMEDFAATYTPTDPVTAAEWKRRFRPFATGVGSMTLDLTADVWFCMICLAGITVLLTAIGGPVLVALPCAFVGASRGNVVARSGVFVFLAWLSPLAIGFAPLLGLVELHSTSSFAPMMMFLVAGPVLLFFALATLQDAVVKGRPPTAGPEALSTPVKDRRRRPSVATSQPASRTTSQLQRTLNSFGLIAPQAPRVSPRPGPNGLPLAGQHHSTPDDAAAVAAAYSAATINLYSGDEPKNAAGGAVACYVSVSHFLMLLEAQRPFLQLLPFLLLGGVGASVVDAECIGTAGTATMASLTVSALAGAVLRPLLLLALFPAGLENRLRAAASAAGEVRVGTHALKSMSQNPSGEDISGFLQGQESHYQKHTPRSPRKSPRPMNAPDTENQPLLADAAEGQDTEAIGEISSVSFCSPTTCTVLATLLVCGLTAACAVLCSHAIGDVGFFNEVPRATQRVQDGHLLLDAVTAAASGPYYFVFLPSAGLGGVMNATFWGAVASDAGYIIQQTKMPLANLSSVTFADHINITTPELAEVLLSLGNLTGYPYLFNQLVDPTRTLLQVAVYPTFDPFAEAAAPFQDTLDAICNEIQARRQGVYAFVGWYGANAGAWATMQVVVPQWKLGTALGLAGAVLLLFAMLFTASRNNGLASCMPWQSAVVAFFAVFLPAASTLVGCAVIVAVFQFHEALRLVENLPRIMPAFLKDVSGVTWLVFPFVQPILTSVLLALHAHAALRRQSDLQSAVAAIADDAVSDGEALASVASPDGTPMCRLAALLPSCCGGRRCCGAVGLTIEQFLVLVGMAGMLPFAFSSTTLINEIGIMVAVGSLFDVVVGHPLAARIHRAVTRRFSTRLASSPQPWHRR